jgi:hypothetical protein
MTIYKAGSSTNASPDRARMGKYTAENTRLICVGCNMVKSVHSNEETKLLLDGLPLATWTHEDNTFFSQASSESHTIQQARDAFGRTTMDRPKVGRNTT